MFRRIRAAALSLRPVKWDKAGNADRLEAAFRKAARQKPDVIVGPECAIDGYVAYQSIEFPERRQRLIDMAEPIDGGCVKRFRALAKELRTCLAVGFTEKEGNEAYNAAIFIDQAGKIRGHYRKVYMYEGHHPSWNFNRLGDKIRAFDTPFGKAGFLICADRWQPELARALVLDGAQYLLIPSYGNRKAAQNATVLARARENGVPIVEGNVGMNLIVSKGEVVAYKWGHDQITVADIEIPAPASTKNARAAEREYFRGRPKRMHKQYLNTLREIAYRRKKAAAKRKK